MIGYMLTWTTYGCWLQGDRRGWGKDGVIFTANPGLERVNAANLKSPPVRFTGSQQSQVYNAILNHACEKVHKIFALSVAYNHIHLLIKHYDEGPSRLVARYKNNARKGLGDIFTAKPIWTKGSDTRFCNNAKQLSNMIEYIKNHEKLTPYVFVANH